MNGSYSDQELVKQIVDKDADALKFLYEKPIYAFAELVDLLQMAADPVQIPEGLKDRVLVHRLTRKG